MNDFLMFLERNPILSVVVIAIICSSLVSMFRYIFSKNCNCKCCLEKDGNDDE